MFPDGFRFPTPTRENLPRLARLAYDVGAVHCRGCRDYHLTWPYLRALGLNGAGPEFNLPLHVDLLGRVAAGRRSTRWLLAGSADSGVLAAVQATIAALPPAHHRITVVDRCGTPLALCRDHAEQTGLEITTIESNLTEFEPPEAFDVILGHQVLLFFRDEDRPALFRRMASWLTPAGALCLTVSDQSPGAPDTMVHRQRLNEWRVARIREGWSRGEIELPEDPETFVARIAGPLHRVNGDRRFDLAHYVRQLTEAGFGAVETAEMPDADQCGGTTNHGPKRHMIIARKSG